MSGDDLRAELIDLMLTGDADDAVDRARKALDGDMGAAEFFNEVFTPAMKEIGDRFGRLEIYLPELVDAADVAQAVSERAIQPMLAEGGDAAELSRGKVVLCSVQGDIHDIGKNMVGVMLRVNGFEVIDLGINVPVRTVLERAREEEADIVGLSSLMTTSMPYMKEVVELRDGFGLKDAFWVIVGGAPITPEYSAEIGADAFGRDALEAVEQCIALIEASS
jgi:trimethylamine corrinoid protein